MAQQHLGWHLCDSLDVSLVFKVLTPRWLLQLQTSSLCPKQEEGKGAVMVSSVHFAKRAITFLEVLGRLLLMSHSRTM